MPQDTSGDQHEDRPRGDDAPTGGADVDAALARLAELVDLPPADHVGVFEDVHERLKQVLSDLDGS